MLESHLNAAHLIRPNALWCLVCFRYRAQFGKPVPSNESHRLCCQRQRRLEFMLLTRRLDERALQALVNVVRLGRSGYPGLGGVTNFSACRCFSPARPLKDIAGRNIHLYRPCTEIIHPRQFRGVGAVSAPPESATGIDSSCHTTIIGEFYSLRSFSWPDQISDNVNDSCNLQT